METSQDVHAPTDTASPNGAVVTATEVTRRYGEGDTAVDALRGVTLEVSPSRADRDHGPVRLRQVDADAHPRRARPAHLRLRDAGRDAARQPERHRDHEAAPQAHRLHLPVLQPASDAERGGEHPPAALDRRREARQGGVRGAARARRAHGPAHPPPVRALGRPAAAGRGRARARREADRRLRRRADGKPRLEDERRDPAAAPARRSRATTRRWSWSRTTPRRRRSPTGPSSSPTGASSATSAAPTSSRSSRRSRKSR